MLERQILPKIWAQIDTPDVLLLNGARQVGKTTLMEMIKEKLITEKKVSLELIHWFDLEKTQDLLIWSKQTSALDYLPLKDKRKHYLFVDEFQKSKIIGSAFKVIHDHYSNFKIITTGSASWYLTTDESLAGRKTIFLIYPLSFSEFLSAQTDPRLNDFYRVAIKKAPDISKEIVELINSSLLGFLSYGGYPSIVTKKSKQEKISRLGEIIDSYLLRDVQIWNYAANSLQIKQLLTLLADRTGMLLDINDLSANCGLGRNALINRLELFQKTFILNLVRPYFTNKTKELIKNPKIFLVDYGLRNALLENFSLAPKTDEFGKVAENFVFSEFFKLSDGLAQPHYWRTKSKMEVDMIIKKENSIIPVEIKSGNESAIPKGIKSFIEKYHPKTAHVLNWSIIKNDKYQDTEVLFRPLWFPF